MTGSPKAKEQCIEFYERLHRDAVIDDKDRLVWIGKITDVYKELKLTGYQYTRVRALLIQNGSVRWLERGAGGSVGNVPSVIELIRNPEQVVTWANIPLRSLTGQADSAMLQQSIESLARLIGGLDIREALRDISPEISELKQEVAQLKRDTKER